MSENKQELFEKLSPEMLESVSGGNLNTALIDRYVREYKQAGASPDSVIKLLTEGVQSKNTVDEVADYVRKTWDTVPVKPMW